MSKIEKRFNAICNTPTETKWDELTSVLKHYGLGVFEPKSGSHWKIYCEELQEHLTVPVHNNRVKKIYVKRIIEMIEALEGD